MPEILVQLNAESAHQCSEVQARLQAASRLRLYVNDLMPTPASDLLLITEASYDGYQPLDLGGLWSAVEQEEDGVYATVTGELVFEAPTAGAQVVYFAGLEVAGVVRWLVRFTEPWNAVAGGNPKRLRLRYRQFSASVLQ